VIDLEDFNFELDESQIARYPAIRRDESKLMIVHRNTGKIQIEPYFRNIQNYLQDSDTIFFNETKVSKRRVYLKFPSPTNSQSNPFRIHEAIFLEETYEKNWICLVKNAKKLKLGDILFSPNGVWKFTVLEKREKNCLIKPNTLLDEQFFDKEGTIPIPPYLKRTAEKNDEIRYQSIFAKKIGSIASPTASLHMSEELQAQLLKRGVVFSPLHLEIGYGTFNPISEEDLIQKKLHKEKISISQTTKEKWLRATEKKTRRIALGTTSLRALESMHRFGGLENMEDWSFNTDIFLTPGDNIATIDGLITNFHLPKSSLFLLVCAFASKELVLEAYHIAMKNEFRFYSYGDAMFIV
jgi:S-adenosylmethionine:tRNA ribosyltransferase-isomerase